MKTLFILASIMTFIFLAAPNEAEAQKSKTAGKIIEGIISKYECGDNCYLTITDSKGRKHTGLCTALVCRPWNEVAVMPKSYKGTRVRVWVGKGRRYDGGGNFVDTYPAFMKIRFMPAKTGVLRK